MKHSWLENRGSKRLQVTNINFFFSASASSWVSTFVFYWLCYVYAFIYCIGSLPPHDSWRSEQEGKKT